MQKNSENKDQVKPKEITISARRWFSWHYGNTYHVVRIWVDDEVVRCSDIMYGYGEQYLQTAHEMLQEAGYYPRTDDNEADWWVFQGDRRGYNEDSPMFYIAVHDVKRKKDLKRWAQA